MLVGNCCPNGVVCDTQRHTVLYKRCNVCTHALSGISVGWDVSLHRSATSLLNGVAANICWPLSKGAKRAECRAVLEMPAIVVIITVNGQFGMAFCTNEEIIARVVGTFLRGTQLLLQR